jgi:WD40 repeat protein
MIQASKFQRIRLQLIGLFFLTVALMVSSTAPITAQDPSPTPGRAGAGSTAAGINLLYRIGRGVAASSAWSPTGDLLAVGTRGAIYLYDTADLSAEPRVLDAHVGEVTHITFSEDGSRMITASTDEDYLISVWQMPEAELINQIAMEAFVSTISFSSDGTRTVYSFDGRLAVYDTLTSEEIAFIAAYPEFTPIREVASHPEGSEVASVYENEVKLFDLPSGDQRALLTMNSNIERATYNRDGTQIATCAASVPIEIWDTATGERVSTLQSEGQHTSCYVVFDAEGSLYTISSTGLTRWDAQTGAELETFAINFGFGFGSFAFNPDNTQILHSSDLRGVAIYSLDGEQIASFEGYWGSAYDMDISADGSIVAALFAQYTGLYDVRTGELVQEIQTDEDSIGIPNEIALNPNGESVAVGYTNGSMTLFDKNTGRQTGTVELNDEFQQIEVLLYTTDGNTIVAFLGTGDAVIVDALNTEIIRRWQVSESSIRRGAISPDGSGLVTAGQLSSVLVYWDVATGEKVWEKEFGSEPDSILFSPDGQTLYVTHAGSLYLFSATGEALPPLNLLDGLSIFGASLNADGTRLALEIDAAGGRSLLLVDPQNGAVISQEPVAGSVSSLQLSPDGDTLLTRNFDGYVLVWQIG